MKNVRIARLILLTFLFVMLALALAPAAAQALPARIAVAPLWRPGTTLDTLLAPTVDDPVKYVEVQIYVTTTVQFWAAELTCTVNNAALSPYDWDNPNEGGTYPETPDTGDDIAPIIAGSDWGNFGFDYTSIPMTDLFDANTDTVQQSAFTPGTSLGLRLTLSRMSQTGSFTATPLGELGQEENILLATIRYKVDTITPTTLTSPFTCTNIAFLDRNGRSVMTATYSAPPVLSIIKGYSLTGKALYQARTNHAGISVACDGPDALTVPDFTATTNASGVFSQTGIRSLGRFNCDIFGNIIAAGAGPDNYLQARSSFDLVTSSYTLQPVMLRAGNVFMGGTSAAAVDGDDLALITGNPFGVTVPANTAADANGDAKVDRSDLALITSNFGQFENVDSSAMLYSVARTFSGVGFTSDYRVFLGENTAGAVTQLITGTSRDFWPTMSPDGARIAFVRSVGGPIDDDFFNTQPSFALFTVASNGTGAATRLTPTSLGNTFAAFAPSWSPDGARIAFVCTTQDPLTVGGYIDTNDAELCVIDANGRNFKELIFSGVEIFPPAWLTNDIIVFGATGDCICAYDLKNGFIGDLDANIPAGTGDFEDMPLIEDGVLFYRSTDGGGDSEIHMATLDLANLGDPIPAAYADREGLTLTLGAPFHTQVAFDNGGTFDPVSTDVDYYEVSETGYNVVFYEPCGCEFLNVYFSLDGVDNAPNYTGPNAFASRTHFVDSQFGNFDDSFFGFALRNTLDWLP